MFIEILFHRNKCVRITDDCKSQCLKSDLWMIADMNTCSVLLEICPCNVFVVLRRVRNSLTIIIIIIIIIIMRCLSSSAST